jgi:hypothetical protein
MRVYYKAASEVFQNDHEIAVRVNGVSDLKGVIAILKDKRKQAIFSGCDTIILSSEDLFFMLESEQKIAFLMKALKGSGFTMGHIRFVMVFRDLDSFMRSYLKQLVSNGNILSNDDFVDLYEFFIKLIRRFFSLDGVRIAISLDAAKEKNGILSEFFTLVLGKNFIGKERFDNSWGKRTFLSEILCGQLVGLHASNRNLHANEPKSDQYRSELRALVDEASAKPAVIKLFVNLEKKINAEIDLLLTRSRTRLNAMDNDFVSKLFEAGTVKLGLGDTWPSCPLFNECVR